MAHFACKQFVPFFGLLAIRHIQKDSGHLTVVDSAVIAHPRAEIQRISSPTFIRKSISYDPTTPRVATKAARTRSRSAGWICADRSSKLTLAGFGQPPKAGALLIQGKAIIIAVHAHRATPAA
jgi:hypothetical protein